MIKDFFILFWRKSKRNLAFTLINVFGLSIGIAVFILISMWIKHETGYDNHQERAENVYRLSFGNSSYLTAGEGPYFAENITEIEKVVRFKTWGKLLFTYNNESYYSQNFRLADSTVFDIFTYDFILGDPKTALIAPACVVLTESFSFSLFGDENPLGKMIKINGEFPVQVTGVIKDDKDTFNPVDVLGSFVTLALINEQPDFLESLETSQYQTYYLMHDNVDMGKIRDRIHELNIELFSIENPEFENTIQLVNLLDLYFHPIHGSEENHGNRAIVYVFLVISILAISIACINFINLTIAKSGTVALSVGVKKVNGASHKQLFTTFLMESILLCFISALFALSIVQVFLPKFNSLIGADLSLNDYLSVKYALYYLILILVIGCIAGIFPAIHLSAFNPMYYLRKLARKGQTRTGFRTGLVVFQFAISTILIISVVIVAKQLKYIDNYNLGFEKENTILISLSGEIQTRTDAFKERLLAQPGVENVKICGGTMASGTNNEVFYHKDERYLTRFFTIEPGYFDLMGIDLIKGRDFSYDRPADRLTTCVLNMEALEMMELPVDEAVGTILTRRDWYLTTIPSERIEVIGVVDDFHFSSLRDSVAPVFICWGTWYNSMNIKISSNNIQETLSGIETVWDEFAPGFPFEFRFMDDHFDSQYNDERKQSEILIYFAIVAILIALLGLLGLTSFLLQEKVKEIGIRKVFGATKYDLISHLSSSFMKWVVLALVIGTPLSIFLINKWLNGFAYRTNLAFWIFLVSWLALILLSFLTIIFQTLKVSNTNPIDSLRYE